MLLSWETVNTILLVDEAERRCPSSLEQATHKDDPGQPARTFLQTKNKQMWRYSYCYSYSLYVV